jgi:hypothetical protein
MASFENNGLFYHRVSLVSSALRVFGGIGKRQGDPSRWLGRLVFLGEDLWWQLLELVEGYLPSCAVQLGVAACEVCEDHRQKIAGLEEVDGRPYRPLDLSDSLCEDLEVPDWPEGWDEERIWGDISPQERRSLQRLLGSRAPKCMDT